MKPSRRFPRAFTATVRGVTVGVLVVALCSAPGFASALQDESKLNTSLLWILLGALVLAGLAYLVGRSIGKSRSRRSSTSETSPGPTTRNLPVSRTETESYRTTLTRSAAEDSQPERGRRGGRGFIVAQWQHIQARTSWLFTPAALDRWWVQIPARLRRYSVLLSVAWADGVYFTAWPRLAMLLPLGALVLGCVAGASHWSLFVIGQSGVSTSGPFVVFAQSVPFVMLAVAAGAFSTNLGLMLVIGYVLGDYILAGPQLARASYIPSLLPSFFYTRTPLILCYGLFFMLAVMPGLSMSSSLVGLMRKVRGADIGSKFIRIANGG